MSTVSLFIHSTGTSPSMWDGLPASVVGSTHKIAPYNIGYDPAEPLARGTPSGASHDASHVMRAVPDDADRVHIYAHSYGGLVAAKMIPMLGARLGSLWLYEPVMFGALNAYAGIDDASKAEVQFFLDNPWFLDDEARAGRAEWLELFIDYWNRKGSWARMPEAARVATEAVGWKMFQEVRACFLDNVSFEAARFTVPTTLVTAERSTASARAMVRALAQVNPEAIVDDLAGTGHMGLLTHPARVHPSLVAHAARVHPTGVKAG